MKIARVMTYAPFGLKGEPVTVEVATRPGLSSLTFVGLAGRAVAESKERIRIALRGLGIPLPTTTVVVNLAPAELIKNGPHYDLPIAVALLLAMGELPADVIPPDTIIAGELGLGGDLRRLRQAITFCTLAAQANHPIILPRIVRAEVGLTKHTRVALYSHLNELVQAVRERSLKFVPVHHYIRRQLKPERSSDDINFDDIAGQPLAKHALAMAIAGGHHLLLTGPPGVGKSMLVQAAASLLPALNRTERLECTTIYSAAGLLSDHEPVVWRAPFRNPHHRASVAALVGGGANPKPGELSLAHRGLLFLDELPHFSSPSLEALREPLQSRVSCINRAYGKVEYPSSFILIGAFNPCPCGWAGDSNGRCSCSSIAQANYLARLSGPIIDRFALFVRCQRVTSMIRPKTGESEHLKTSRRVAAARVRQYHRQGSLNGELNPRQLQNYLQLPWLAKRLDQLLRQGKSVRQAHQTVRVALTIADLNEEELADIHLMEAIALLPPIDIKS